MRNPVFTVVVLTALMMGLGGETVRANDTGLATSLHASARVGSLLCLTEHEHLGSSTAQRSKRGAIKAAILSWRQFTAWEYGSDWARWRLAKGKRITCSNSASGFACDVTARPCRKLVRRSVRRRKQ